MKLWQFLNHYRSPITAFPASCLVTEANSNLFVFAMVPYQVIELNGNMVRIYQGGNTNIKSASPVPQELNPKVIPALPKPILRQIEARKNENLEHLRASTNSIQYVIIHGVQHSTEREHRRSNSMLWLDRQTRQSRASRNYTSAFHCAPLST